MLDPTEEMLDGRSVADPGELSSNYLDSLLALRISTRRDKVHADINL